MIFEVRFENFRSLKKPTIFDIRAESICEFKDSIMKWNRNKTDEYKVVPLKFLYGQNGSGKTNLLLGILTLKEMISAGRIDRCLSTPYEELVSDGDCTLPISLGISFLYQNHVIEYDITFKREEVVKETLSVNRSLLFTRQGNELELAKTNKAVEYFDEQRIPSLEINERQFRKYRIQDLFLTQAFKCFIAPGLGGSIQDYFENKLHIMMDASVELAQKKEWKHAKEIAAFLKSIHVDADLNSRVPLAKGTTRLINFAELLFSVLEDGGVIVVDELDVSIDPNLMIPLLSRLHDPKINKHETQLIVSTFNPVYLNKYFVRRDEVTFVSKGNEGTTLKTLIEYANRENNYMRKYLSGEYDTIAPIDYKKLYQR